MQEEQKRIIQELVSSGDIPSLVDVMVMLHKQNLNQSETNRILFGKLDKAADAAMEAKDEAKKASDKAEISALTGEEVKNEFVKLNGKTSKTIERVATLEDIEKRRKEDEEKRAFLKAGMKVIPNKLYNILVVLGNILLGILAIIGAIASVLEVIRLLFKI